MFFHYSIYHNQLIDLFRLAKWQRILAVNQMHIVNVWNFKRSIYSLVELVCLCLCFKRESLVFYWLTSVSIQDHIEYMKMAKTKERWNSDRSQAQPHSNFVQMTLVNTEQNSHPYDVYTPTLCSHTKIGSNGFQLLPILLATCHIALLA